jgi:hypothetical protein
VGKGNEKGRGENGVGSGKKNFLAGLEIPAFRALSPAARQGLATVAKARVHGETTDKPTTLGQQERSSLRPLPRHPCDTATVSQVRASRQCRIPLDTNRYAGPAHDAGHTLTRKTSPDRRCLYHGDQLIARHIRRYDRFQAGAEPDHPPPLLAQHKKARDPPLFRRFLALSPRAEAYSLQRDARRLNPPHPVRKIVALRDLYAPESVARAMDAAFPYEACSAEDITNLLAPRARFTPAASALHLTRRDDLLAIRLAPPALSLYQATPQTTPQDT